jgi:hypothetical protein
VIETGVVHTEPADPPVMIFLTNGVNSSAGAGPGPRTVPADEAARLVARRHAVYGDRPPRGYRDGGVVASGAITAQ